VSSALAVKPEPGPSPHVARIHISSTGLFTAAFVILLLAPLAFGAVEPWAVFALEASSAVLFAAWLLRQYRGAELRLAANPVYLPMLAFLALVLLQCLTGITAYRTATYSLLLLYLSYGAMALVATQSLRRSSQVRSLAPVLCIYGGVLAFFALLQGIAPNGKLYWIWSTQGGAIYGPYVNHNHYAGLMEMLTPFPIVLAASRLTHGNRKIAAAVIGALMAGTIFLSESRGGMIAFGVQMAALLVLLRPKQQNWRQPAVFAIFLGVMIGLLVWVGGNELTRRLESIHSEAQQEISGGVRLTIIRDSFRMWLVHPLFGWGLGTFSTVYPQFRSFYTTFFVNQAHNDYMQLLVETGVTGVAIGIWLLVATFRTGLSKLANWTENANGTLTAAALLGVIGILVHSFLDFNLQIPANAAMFYVLCAIAAAGSVEESRRQRRRSQRHSLILEPTQETPAS